MSNRKTRILLPAALTLLLAGVAASPLAAAVPDPGWSLSFHGGINDPQGDFGRVFDSGPSAGLDLEYLFNSRWAIELFVGYDEFDGPFEIDLEVYHYSVNGKVYFGATTRWFLLAGIGSYDFDPGPSEDGFNLGTGVQHNLNSRLAVEFTAKFHSVSSGDLEFLTYHGGLRIRF